MQLQDSEVAIGDKLTEKTVLLSELGDSEKVTKEAGDKSLATLDSAEPGDSSSTTSAVDEPRFNLADPDEVDAAIAKRKNKIQPILDYLKDK